MLTIFDSDDRCSRRAFLRVGSLALGGMSLANRQAVNAAAPTMGRPILKDRSIIFLFLQGGPSQFETFDPKMDAPVEFRSVTGEVKTRIPGVTFGSTFVKLAELADKVSILRSYVPGDANHDLKPLVCNDTFGANLGSIYARVAGANHPGNGMPTNILLLPRAVDDSTRTDNERLTRLQATGGLGGAYAPFAPSTGSALQSDLRLKVPIARLEDRRALLREFDRVQAALADARSGGDMEQMREQALRAMLGGVADAFDLSKEDPRVLAAYNTAPLVPAARIERRWLHSIDYLDYVRTIGKQLLLARRLCERGAGFVTVTTNFVWDMHADTQGKNAPLIQGMNYMGTPLDHALATFIRDVAERGLSDKILLVACGEMGRTPRINKDGGRDHWGNIGAMLMTGGGLRMGQVIGRSSRSGGEPASTPIRIQNVIATILRQVFDTGELRTIPGLPRDIAQTLPGWEPIDELV